jgi:hypothetical protein
MATFTGTIQKFEIQDASRRATITLNPPSSPSPLKLSDDSDTEFLGMCAVCAAAISASPPKPVTATVTSGANDEIDILSV